MRIVKCICTSLYISKSYSVQIRHHYYLTTPIFYVNAKPHIGHLYTALLADALTRYQNIKHPGKTTTLMTGTDEHGIKIQQAAERAGKSELKYVDEVSEMYRRTFSMYNINYSEFVRTTDQRHRQCVHTVWNRLKGRGLIYQGEYSGWYCTADEAFIPDNQLQSHPDGTKTTLDGNRPVEFVSEVNYKFALSSFQGKLLDWLSGDVVRPSLFQHQVRNWVEEGTALQDLSVSRPRSRVPWGIPVPGDPSHTIYVWLDALCSYLTGAGGANSFVAWPPDLQIVGKDILKFHSIYWPAFLMGAGLDPPRRLLCHSHWLIDGHKMSKTAGNVLDPSIEAEKYSCEGFRYFLLREAVPHNDSNYSAVKVQRILNAELADTLGNLLSRCTGKLVNAAQVVPGFNAADHQQYCSQSAQELIEGLEALPEVVDRHYDNLEIYKSVDAIVSVLHLANGFFEKEKPWELRKRPEALSRLNAVLHVIMETLRVCGVLLSPVVPVLSQKLLTKLSVPEDKRSVKDLTPLSWQQSISVPERRLGEEQFVFFPKIK